MAAMCRRVAQQGNNSPACGQIHGSAAFVRVRIDSSPGRCGDPEADDPGPSARPGWAATSRRCHKRRVALSGSAGEPLRAGAMQSHFSRFSVMVP